MKRTSKHSNIQKLIQILEIIDVNTGFHTTYYLEGSYENALKKLNEKHKKYYIFKHKVKWGQIIN